MWVFKKFKKYSKRAKKRIFNELEHSEPVYNMFAFTPAHVDNICQQFYNWKKKPNKLDEEKAKCKDNKNQCDQIDQNQVTNPKKFITI